MNSVFQIYIALQNCIASREGLLCGDGDSCTDSQAVLFIKIKEES